MGEQRGHVLQHLGATVLTSSLFSVGSSRIPLARATISNGWIGRVKGVEDAFDLGCHRRGQTFEHDDPEVVVETVELPWRVTFQIQFAAELR
jgi:hypothetical protein